jgi:hypothetical protein
LSISKLKALQISKMVEHILHVPGNFRGGNLEMTVVVSSRLSFSEKKESVKEVADALKRSSEVFRNVRLNLVRWDGISDFNSEVVPMVFLQTGACFAQEQAESEQVPLDFEQNRTKSERDQSDFVQERTESEQLAPLLAYLKKFHARSKVILVFASKACEMGDKAQAHESLAPFLKQKLLLLCGDEPVTGTNLFLNRL